MNNLVWTSQSSTPSPLEHAAIVKKIAKASRQAALREFWGDAEVRCEADWNDGGVCLTPLRANGSCPNALDHTQQ
jgi:hypothetical protein